MVAEREAKPICRTIREGPEDDDVQAGTAVPFVVDARLSRHLGASVLRVGDAILVGVDPLGRRRIAVRAGIGKDDVLWRRHRGRRRRPLLALVPARGEGEGHEVRPAREESCAACRPLPCLKPTPLRPELRSEALLHLGHDLRVLRVDLGVGQRAVGAR